MPVGFIIGVIIGGFTAAYIMHIAVKEGWYARLERYKEAYFIGRLVKKATNEGTKLIWDNPRPRQTNFEEELEREAKYHSGGVHNAKNETKKKKDYKKKKKVK